MRACVPRETYLRWQVPQTGDMRVCVCVCVEQRDGRRQRGSDGVARRADGVNVKQRDGRWQRGRSGAARKADGVAWTARWPLMWC